MHLEYPEHLSISKIVKMLKGCSPRLLQKDFPDLKKDIGISVFGRQLMCWSIGNLTEELLNEYHRKNSKVLDAII
ncbi:transposase [Lentisphaera profundi]|uniref:transposase n=1 Tax=Lentisphaera profundi TaxID=1658616 RepID=UPI003B679D65